MISGKFLTGEAHEFLSDQWREQLKEKARSMPRVELMAERDARLFPWSKHTNDTPLPLTPFRLPHKDDGQ